MKKSTNIKYPVIPYALPFGLLFLFIYIAPMLNLPKDVVYPAQTIVVAGALLYFRNIYKDEIKLCFDMVAILGGIIVFAVWVLSEGYYPQIGESQFNPFEYGTGTKAYILMGVRIAGATFVIPVMEELFWRSFALRFLVSEKFTTVPLGQFTWFSFIAVSVAFGFEHHRWLPGIFAGLVYAGLLYRSKNLFSPILSHAVTNLLLGIYVILTGKWTFW